jgi:hypothetical protein
MMVLTSTLMRRLDTTMQADSIYSMHNLGGAAAAVEPAAAVAPHPPCQARGARSVARGRSSRARQQRGSSSEVSSPEACHARVGQPLVWFVPKQTAAVRGAACRTTAASIGSSAACHDAGAAADPAEIDALDERPSPHHEGRRSHVPYVDDDPAEAAMAAVGRYMDAVVKVPTASSAVLTPHSITCISTVSQVSVVHTSKGGRRVPHACSLRC